MNTTSTALKNQPARLREADDSPVEDLDVVLADIMALWAEVVAENERELHLVSDADARRWDATREHVSDKLAVISEQAASGNDETRETASRALLDLTEELSRHEHRDLAPHQEGRFTKVWKRLLALLPGRKR